MTKKIHYLTAIIRVLGITNNQWIRINKTARKITSVLVIVITSIKIKNSPKILYLVKTINKCRLD